MGIPASLISSLGNVIAALTDLVSAITGDNKMVVKSSSVQKSIGNPMPASGTQQSYIDNNNLPLPEKKREEAKRPSIYENPDIHLTVPELIQKHGFPFESHEVVTKDKYVISVFRIPYGRQGPHFRREDKPPVLLVHGLLNSAGAWVMNEADKALAYMLADGGYDCWMLNGRGCSYSRGHETLTPDDKAFWEFSFHEMGTMDVPATIDHILAVTGHSRLNYIGHSLGNTKLMIAINQDEKIVEKIKLFICFAPAVYLYRTTAKLLSFNAPFFKQQKAFLDYFTTGELMSKTFLQQMKMLPIGFLASPEYLASKCVTASMFMMGGFNPDQINWPYIPIVAGHTPSSTSVKTYIHCLQYFTKSEFRQYDYGSVEENKKAYGESIPPKYDLSKVVCPTVIFYGENDLLCRPMAVEQLSQELPNVIGCQAVECERFSHTDFLYAKDADQLVYSKVLKLLEQ